MSKFSKVTMTWQVGFGITRYVNRPHCCSSHSAGKERSSLHASTKGMAFAVSSQLRLACSATEGRVVAQAASTPSPASHTQDQLQQPASGYEAWDGTSMATPHVAGVAALVWAHKPTWTNAQLREALERTAQDLGAAGRDNYYGHGLVQAKSALDYLRSRYP